MNKQELLNIYKYKTELHAHTMPASQCCDCAMERFLEHYSENDVNAICLTNHFYKENRIFLGKSKDECINAYLSDYEKLKILAKPYGIRIILGCEIRFIGNPNDYLIYGVNKEILEQSFDCLNYDLRYFRNNVVLSDSLLIQAHPFRDQIIPADPRLIDGIETMNFHPNHNSRNSVAAAYAKKNNISICTGGSDFHHDKPFHPAAIIMLSKTLPKDSFGLAKILKGNDYIFLLGDNHIIIP